MADQTLLGGIAALSPSSATFDIYKLLTNGTATPEVIFGAANVVPHNFRVLDFKCYNSSGAVQAGATARLQSNLNNAGLVAVSDLLDIQIQDAIARATTISVVQGILTVGHAVEDILNIAKHANTDAGIATVTAMLV